MSQRVLEYSMDNVRSLVPEGIGNYVKFGKYDHIEKIIRSKIFLPVYITGLARSGKTTMVEQSCHDLGRECVRVNITEQTDEDDLIGGFRLQDGNTVWFDGPVVVAMERGAILLIDEIDLASYKCMCLQPVTEGSNLYLKKIGKVINPKHGFNIVATANTKGQGDPSGKFHGANYLNESFLDRFAITLEHTYPPREVEKQIMMSHLTGNVSNLDEMFVGALLDWTTWIRQNYLEGRASEIVSTGRLIHIVKTYSVFGNPFLAVEYGIARFNEVMRDAFYDMFKKMFKFNEEDFKDNKVVGGKDFFKKAMENMDTSAFNVRNIND